MSPQYPIIDFKRKGHCPILRTESGGDNPMIKNRSMLGTFAAILCAGMMYGCGSKEAEVVCEYVYTDADDGSTDVTIQTAESVVVTNYTLKPRLVTDFQYNPYNPRQISSAFKETYLWVDDGRQVLAGQFIKYDPYGQPESEFLLSPDSVVIAKFLSNGIFTNLPYRRYEYDGDKLALAAQMISQSRIRLELSRDSDEDVWLKLGDIDSINVIFSRDFKSVKAVLPRMRQVNGTHGYEIGFTFIDMPDGDSLLPYIFRWTPTTRQKSIFDKIPASLEKDFALLGHAAQ
jgi:hypothetical protein